MLLNSNRLERLVEFDSAVVYAGLEAGANDSQPERN